MATLQILDLAKARVVIERDHGVIQARFTLNDGTCFTMYKADIRAINSAMPEA